MEIKIGLAKTAKYANEVCGDCCDIAERPHGGISAIIADGQGNGLSAHHTSSWVVNKAVQLILDGARDGAVARAVHDYLYAMKDKKVSCTLTVVSADLDTETAVISRNSNCPVIVKTEEYESVYDESVEPIGVNRHMKPLMYEIPLEAGMTIRPLFTAVSADGSEREYEGDEITVPEGGLTLQWGRIPAGDYLYCFGLTDLAGEVHYTDSVDIHF
jgi:serine phosphatase RsbU (regulator of sigma subunit)